MENFCGLCKAKGLKKQLILFQLNLEEAILLCENKECVYPLGVSSNATLIVKRQASEVVNFKRKRKKNYKQGKNEETETSTLKFRCLDSYLHWKNINSLCWLHSLLSLIVHNVTLSTLAHNVDSLIRTLTDSFNKAQELSSVNREQAEKGLEAAREKVWKYLQPKMKCEHGVNDSPVTALPLLLRENCTLLEKTLQSYQWKFSCCACGYRQVDRRRKHLVTFPNVADGFDLEDPTFLRPCFKCGAPKQRSMLVYERMPDCIFLHFEQGLQHPGFEDLELNAEDGHYVMTQFIQYKKNPDHFVCWAKEPRGKRWMEVDDLKSPACRWSSALPIISPSEVHIAVWERQNAFVQSPQYSATRTITAKNIPNEPANEAKPNFPASRTVLMPSLRTDSDMNVMSHCNDERRLFSLSHRSALSRLPPVLLRSRPLFHESTHKLAVGKFEPYIPRKKRIVSYSCPNSPLCAKSDAETSATPLSSPGLPAPFLTWQDIKEQNKKFKSDELQSDSGYSSPASVSSCSSLPSCSSSNGDAVVDCSEALNVHSDEKQGLGHCVDVEARSSSKDTLFNCHSNTDLLQGVSNCTISDSDSCRSADLANKLEELLPDCLLENPERSLQSSAIKDDQKLKLADFEKLSEEQDKFIRDLLAA